MDYYSAIKMNFKKECHLQQHVWTQQLSYEAKSERETQILHDITYMWNLKNYTNELIYKTGIDSQT